MTPEASQESLFYENAWRLFPHTYAATASRGLWQPYSFLSYIGEVITPLLIKGNARIVIEAPPRHGKSEFISKWLGIWFLEHFHGKSLMMSSYSHDLATDFGRKIRDEIINNELINVKLNPLSFASNDFKTSSGGRCVAVGVGGTMTGRGAHLMLLDDLYKDWVEAQSKTIREKRWSWWESTAESRLEPGASVIIVSTRWHKDDLTGKLLKKEGEIKDGGKWLRLRFPALSEGPEKDPLRRPLDFPLVPERYSTEFLKDRREKRSKKIWEALYQQNPVDSEGVIVKREWLRFYQQRPTKFDQIITSWDLTFKGTDQSDYVVGGVFAKVGADFYLLDLIRDQMRYVAAKSAVKSMAQKWPMIFNHIVEDKANGPALMDDLQSEVAGLEGFNPLVSKPERLELVSPIIKSGNFYLPTPDQAPWVEDYIEELVNCPEGDTFDQVDVTTQALIRLQGGFDWLRAMTRM